MHIENVQIQTYVDHHHVLSSIVANKPSDNDIGLDYYAPIVGSKTWGFTGFLHNLLIAYCGQSFCKGETTHITTHLHMTTAWDQWSGRYSLLIWYSQLESSQFVLNHPWRESRVASHPKVSGVVIVHRVLVCKVSTSWQSCGIRFRSTKNRVGVLSQLSVLGFCTEISQPCLNSPKCQM